MNPMHEASKTLTHFLSVFPPVEQIQILSGVISSLTIAGAQLMGNLHRIDEVKTELMKMLSSDFDDIARISQGDHFRGN